MNTKLIIPIVAVTILLLIVVTLLIVSQKHHAAHTPTFTLTTNITPKAASSTVPT